MTYLDLLRDADRQLDDGRITIGEYEQMIKPLECEVQPEVVRCRECKHWKDSDGVYRRGISAESKCPVNSRQVYEGTFFCGMAERRTE